MTERLMGHCKSTSNRVAGREMHFGDSSLDAGREISGGEAGAVGLWSIDCSNSLCVDTATTASQGRIIIMLIVLALHSSLIIGAGFVVSTDTGEDCRVRISTKKRRVLRSCWCVSNQPWCDFAPVRALMRERVCTWKFGWRTLKLRRRLFKVRVLLTWRAKFVSGVEKVALPSTSCRRGGGEFKVVNALIDAGATVDQAGRVDDGATPLLTAAGKGGHHHEVVMALIAAGANVDLARSAGGTPLFWAAADGTPTSC